MLAPGDQITPAGDFPIPSPDHSAAEARCGAGLTLKEKTVAKKRMIRAVVAACAAGAVVALPGVAQAGLISGLLGAVVPTCGTIPQPFAQFGDNGNYYAVPNLGMESGTSGWTLTGGASGFADNEPWQVSGTGTHALSLPPGSSATTPATCINLLSPHIRMFADGSDANGPVKVQVIFHGLTGNLLGILNYGTFQPGSYPDWQPSADVFSLLALPLATTSVQVKFTPVTTQGSWKIDDVYIDPFR